MKLTTGNLFTDPTINKQSPESFESIFFTDDFLIERIVTNSTFKTPGIWYDQEKDEWVVLLQGKAELEFENEKVHNLIAGSYIIIPAHKKHRLKDVSSNPNCVWLAIHGYFK